MRAGRFDALVTDMRMPVLIGSLVLLLAGLVLKATRLLAERLPVSLQLAAAAMAFALLVSIPLGVIAALRRNSWIDYLCTGYTVAGFAIPNFGLALILIYVFSIQLDWLPITGIGTAWPSTSACWRALTTKTDE